MVTARVIAAEKLNEFALRVAKPFQAKVSGVA